MADWVVDTNVLLVATCAHLGRPPRYLARRGKDVPVEEGEHRQAVFEWVRQLRESRTDKVVIDTIHRFIQDEYANKLDKDEYGRMVIAHKISRGQCIYVEIEKDEQEDAEVQHPAGEEVVDKADRRMVTAALESGTPIANACDTDWYDLEKGGTLGRLGISVTQLIHDWCHGEWQRKKTKLT